MAQNAQVELHAASDPVRTNVRQTDIDVDVEKKREEQHVEHADGDYDETKIARRDVEYDAQEDLSKRTGLRRLLRRNPSVEFIRELAAKDEEILEPKQVRALEKRIFWMIVPALCIDYIFYYVDKTTLSYAALFGIRQDLQLRGTNYSTLSSIFYAGWLAWALPGNLLMAKACLLWFLWFPISKYLGINIALWGVFLMAQGGANSFAEMVVFRIISGAFEAVAKPGFMAITAMWFTRQQQPLVIGCWYASQGIGIGLGGILGFGIGQLRMGIASWRMIFLLIGAGCFLWGVAMAFIIPDSPHTTTRFTREEKLVIMSRKRDDYHQAEKRQINWGQCWECVVDIKIWLYFLLGLTANIPNGGTSNFGTLMTRGFGFNTLNTTLLQIPYGLCQTLFIVCAICVNHKTWHLNIRTYLMAAVLLIVVAGFAMMAWGRNQATKLIGYYFTGASNATFSLSLALVTSNTGGNTKKMIASAVTFMGTAVGNIVGPYAFFESEAPTYTTGIIVCLVSRVAEILVILLLRLTFTMPNRKRDKLFAEGNAEYDPSTVTYEDQSDLKNMHFRYLA